MEGQAPATPQGPGAGRDGNGRLAGPPDRRWGKMASRHPGRHGRRGRRDDPYLGRLSGLRLLHQGGGSVSVGPAGARRDAPGSRADPQMPVEGASRFGRPADDPRDGKCVAIDFPGDHADGVFSDAAELVLDHLSKLASQPKSAIALPEAVRALAAGRGRVAQRLRSSGSRPQHGLKFLPSASILTRLPETGAALFGRQDELRLLDEAWSSLGKTGVAQIRILVFTAHGGVGKSTLVNHWLQEMQRERFRGASRVFGWSFYSQGTRDQMASADAFIDAALRFFGDSGPRRRFALGQGRAPRTPGRQGACVAGARRPGAAPVGVCLRSRQAARPGPRLAARRAGPAAGGSVPHHHARAAIGSGRAGGRSPRATSNRSPRKRAGRCCAPRG